ncbi:MAG: pyruvate kinase [Thermoleophilia bacterium]|nr:pyruvate kinase [Thermoleophilia bacterium]
MRRTKIVATLGPSTEGERQIREMIKAGVDCVRLNFSHGDHSKYARSIALIRDISAELRMPVAVIADLQGPKTRVGEMPPGGVKLIRGRDLILTPRRVGGTADAVPVNHDRLGEMVKKGDRILLNDGRISLRVLEAVPGGDVRARVTVGGLLVSRKGLNVPGTSTTVPALTAKDEQDLAFSLQAGVDFVALSFVRSARDVEELRDLIRRRTDRPVKTIAKIEKQEAVRDISAIIEAADAVMIARGDLGVEIGPERVPYWQKEIIRRCIIASKPVITATEMLESMIERPVPTRAEASDVANAVYDGTDALMLSGETAVGKYPVKSVGTMHRIAGTVESSMLEDVTPRIPAAGSMTGAISAAACELADTLGASALVTPTSSGTTALKVSRHRPRAPILAISSDMDVVRQLSLSWGVLPLFIRPARNTDEMFKLAIDAAAGNGFARPGDLIVITAGVQVNVPGTTNLIKVHLID